MADLVDRELLLAEAPVVRQNLKKATRHGLTVFRSSGSQTAVVFVHGLTGHKFETWLEFPALIAQDSSCTDYEFGFFGYPTSVFSLRHVVPLIRPYDIKSKARELAEELIAAQTQLGWRRLVVVAHSLGGLIVLAALHTCVERRAPNDRNLLRCIKELVFYGTPFLGSDRVGHLTALLSPDLRALFKEDSYRSTVIMWTRGQQIADLLRLDATYARINVLYSATDFWVDTESARARFPGDSQFNSSHTGLCKPKSRSERPYLFLMEVLKRAARAPLDQQEAQQDNATAQRIRGPDNRYLPAVRELYEMRLPREERVPWGRILESLQESPAAQNNPSLNMRYLTIQLSREKVCGFSSALTVHGCRYAWFAYLAAAPGVALDVGRRLAQQLAREIARTHPDCLGFIFEVDDPEALLESSELESSEELRRRRARIRLYRRLGPIYHICGLHYLQPRLEPDSSEKELRMQLMFAPIPHTTQLRYLTRDEVVEILRLIQTVQANAFRNHVKFSEYQDYLLRWQEEQARLLPAYVELKLSE